MSKKNRIPRRVMRRYLERHVPRLMAEQIEADRRRKKRREQTGWIERGEQE